VGGGDVSRQRLFMPTGRTARFGPATKQEERCLTCDGKGKRTVRGKLTHCTACDGIGYRWTVVTSQPGAAK